MANLWTNCHVLYLTGSIRENWKAAEYKQTDDVLLIGIRFVTRKSLIIKLKIILSFKACN